LLSFANSNGIRPFSPEYFVKVSEDKRDMRQIFKALDYLNRNKEMIRLRNNRYLTSIAMEVIKKKGRKKSARERCHTFTGLQGSF